MSNKAFVQNVEMSVGRGASQVGEWLDELIDVVVQLHSTKHGKRVSEIYYPATKTSKFFDVEVSNNNSRKVG